MKAAGWVSIAVASVLMFVALGTLINNAVLNPQVPASVIAQANATVGYGMLSAPDTAWKLYSAAEALIGCAFLIPGIALVSKRT